MRTSLNETRLVSCGVLCIAILAYGALGGKEAMGGSAYTIVASGEAGTIEPVEKTMLNRILAQRREYELELDAIGWSSIFDGQRIREDLTLAESKTLLRRTQDMVAKYRKQTDDLFARMQLDIEVSGLKPEAQRSMLADFDKIATRRKAQAIEFWLLEEQALVQVENVFNLLDTRRNAWRFRGNQIQFNHQGDLELYKSYLSTINQIITRQREIQEEGGGRTQRLLNTLSN